MSAERPGRMTIDVGAIASHALAPLRPNLVTRPTGRAVRGEIEARLAGNGPAPFVTLVDLTRVEIIDFSCADEVVAKLLARYLRPDRPGEAFFLLRVVGEVHRHALEEVLARHGLAAVCDFGEAGCQLLGAVSGDERAAWRTLEARRRICREEMAAAVGEGADSLLHGLAARRVAYFDDEGAALSLSALATDGRG